MHLYKEELKSLVKLEKILSEDTSSSGTLSVVEFRASEIRHTTGDSKRIRIQTTEGRDRTFRLELNGRITEYFYPRGEDKVIVRARKLGKAK